MVPLLKRLLINIEFVVILNLRMKNSSFIDQESIPKNMYQSGVIPHFAPPKPHNISRDYSIEHKIRRISPLPQQRFSYAPNNFIYQIPTYPSNEYQLHVRNHQQVSNLQDNQKIIQQLLARLEKLEIKIEKTEKLELKVDHLESNINKFQYKVEILETKNDQSIKNKENISYLSNVSKKDEELKASLKDYISREEVQKHIAQLDASVKFYIKEFRQNNYIETRDKHAKQKKSMIEIIATQINDKMEHLRQFFINELQSKMKDTLKEISSKQPIKSIFGLSKQKFMGNPLPLKLNEDLSIMSNGNWKKIATIDTMFYFDNNGYLLDSNFYYLLDKNSNQIRLNENHMQLLKKEGLLTQLDPKYTVNVKREERANK